MYPIFKVFIFSLIKWCYLAYQETWTLSQWFWDC